MSDNPQPYLRFYHSEELREKTLAVLEELEQAENPKKSRGALGDLVVELTNTGLDYYFLRPLELAEAGFVAQKTAKMGMKTAQRMMGPMIRRVIGGMNKQQLLSICSYIRELMD